jgi:hypothetical protein
MFLGGHLLDGVNRLTYVNSAQASAPKVVEINGTMSL